MQSAPKYSKIVLKVRGRELEFLDSGMFISGDYLVIVQDTNDSLQNTQLTRGELFKMSDIWYYETYKS